VQFCSLVGKFAPSQDQIVGWSLNDFKSPLSVPIARKSWASGTSDRLEFREVTGRAQTLKRWRERLVRSQSYIDIIIEPWSETFLWSRVPTGCI